MMVAVVVVAAKAMKEIYSKNCQDYKVLLKTAMGNCQQYKIPKLQLMPTHMLANSLTIPQIFQGIASCYQHHSHQSSYVTLITAF